MAKIYFRRIMAGQMTLEEVPERWREQVREMLEEAMNEGGDSPDGQTEPEPAGE